MELSVVLREEARQEKETLKLRLRKKGKILLLFRLTTILSPVFLIRGMEL